MHSRQNQATLIARFLFVSWKEVRGSHWKEVPVRGSHLTVGKGRTSFVLPFFFARSRKCMLIKTVFKYLFQRLALTLPPNIGAEAAGCPCGWAKDGADGAGSFGLQSLQPRTSQSASRCCWGAADSDQRRRWRRACRCECIKTVTDCIGMMSLSHTLQ